MKSSYLNRRPPSYSTEPALPYRENPSPPPYPNFPSTEYRNEQFRYFYLDRKKDAWLPALADFLAKNKDYKFELHKDDAELCLILPEDCYMFMELEELRRIYKKMETAVNKSKLLHYWKVDKIKNYLNQWAFIHAKLRNEYEKRLEQDEVFRMMEAMKTPSARLEELTQRVSDFFDQRGYGGHRGG